jgi:hypothetical protein
MGIFKAIGFGIFLLVLAVVMPRVLSELTNTIIVFLQSASKAFTAAGQLANYAGHVVPQ